MFLHKRIREITREETRLRIESDLSSELTELPRNDWRFKADPKRSGVSEKWHSLSPDST